MAVVLAPRVRSEREREMAQVERARRKVEEQREDEATALPTGERVAQVVRGALAGHLGEVLTVRFGRGARIETVDFRLVSFYRAGALGRTERGCPRWVSYRDLYCSHATVLDPPPVRDAVGRAIARLRTGAPRGDRE